MNTRFFCTYFDTNYLSHGLSLLESLTDCCPEAHLYIVCMDSSCFASIKKMDFKNVSLLNIHEIESAIPELLIAKSNRKHVEYFYTCSSAICYYIMKYFPDVDQLTYLDADLYFFSSPDPIFDELEGKSIGIIEHKFSLLSKRNIKYGRFNVGWITFRNDEIGIRCLTEWKNACIEWCYQKVEENRYADQKYLDYWPEKYPNVHIIKNLGANLAIWNVGNFKLRKNDNIILVDNTPLIFYHFANFKQISSNEFKTDLSRVLVRFKGIIKDDIYGVYAYSIMKYNKSNSLIKAKEDLHVNGILSYLRRFTHIIREFFFPDILKM